MATFVALYSHPHDVAAFEEHYRTTHLKLVESWPGVTRVTVTRFAATPRGETPPFHLMATVEWASDEEMAAALRSEPAVAAARDAKHMAQTFGAVSTMLVGGAF